MFAGSELLAGIGEVATELVELGHLSEQTGIAAKDLEFFGYVVEQNDGSAQEFNNSLTILQRSLGRTGEATSPQSESLTKLGIATKNAAGETRGMNEILPDIFAKFSELKNPTDEARVASDLFGRSGVKLIPILRKGAQGLEEYRAKFEELGAPGEEEIKRAQDYERGVKRLGKAFGELKQGFVVAMLPALTKVADFLQVGTSKLRKWLESTTLASHATAALGLAIGGPLLKALAPFLKSGLKFAGIYLAFDDLMGFLEGKDSVIGDILDGAFGFGTADTVRAWVADATALFQGFVASTDDAYIALGDSNESWITRALAGVGLLFNGSVSTFDAIKEGWTSILADMGIAIDDFFLKVYSVWNKVVDLVGFTGVLDIDTKSAEDEKATLTKTKDDLQKKAYERESGTGEFADTEVGKRAKERAAKQAEINAAGGAPAPGALASDVVRARGQTAATAAKTEEATAQTATLAGAAKAGTTATINDNKSITFNFAAGTTEEAQASIKEAYLAANREGNRVALQQLTARGSK